MNINTWRPNRPSWRSILRCSGPSPLSIAVSSRSNWLFLLKQDLEEKINCIRKLKAIKERLQYEIKLFERRNREASIYMKEKLERTKVDTDVTKQLRALGYFD